MPNYFAEYDTTVHFISEEELKKNHSGIPHGGFVIRSGKTGWNQENNHVIEYSLKLDSNPEFTSCVIVAYARAAYRLYKEGQSGCKTPFHIQHALTVEAVMKWYANELGYGDDAQYWGIVGLLHDIDFELYPDQHCIKAPELLREGGVSEDIIHGVVSHGYGITVDVAPEHEMEKVLFAADELTGLIWAAALMRPSKSTKDMELKSLKKKYKSKGFAAGCSREVIERGAQQLGWELEKLLTMTLAAMAASEDTINEEIESMNANGSN